MDNSFKKKKFKSTKEVYGIDPLVLAEMTYKDATILMYLHAKKKYEETCDKLFQLHIDKTTYCKSVFLNTEMNKYNKSMKLSALKLEEIGINSTLISTESIIGEPQ